MRGERTICAKIAAMAQCSDSADATQQYKHGLTKTGFNDYSLFSLRLSVWKILMSLKVSFPLSILGKQWKAYLSLPLLSPEG